MTFQCMWFITSSFLVLFFSLLCWWNSLLLSWIKLKEFLVSWSLRLSGKRMKNHNDSCFLTMKMKNLCNKFLIMYKFLIFFNFLFVFKKMLFKIIKFDQLWWYKINTKFLTPLFLIKKSIFQMRGSLSSYEDLFSLQKEN